MDVLGDLSFMKKTCGSRNTLRKSFLFFIFYFLFSAVGAQNFTQRVQQSTGGQGKVTIHQSKEIDQLVNGTAPTTTTTTTPKPTTTTTTTTTPTTTATTTTTTTTDESDTNAEPTKKIMHGYKVTGYRVQAFAGGNTRKDRQEAEHTGNQIKASFPDVPVYVHFYSPRWICRVGNYRTYEEAHQMLLSLRKMGFTEATVVKGKITVPY